MDIDKVKKNDAEEKQPDDDFANGEWNNDDVTEEDKSVTNQIVNNPKDSAAKENPSIEDLKQKVENNEGAEKSGSRDPNYQEMIRGLEALGQKLRQPVPKDSADQIQAAVLLRADCAAICANANAYIRSHKFSVSNVARSRRRHAQEVSRKCRNDAMNLYVIMKNKTIEEQTTWGQVLDKRAGRILQQAGTDGQIEAQVQAAGMQFPKAESSTDFEKWGLLLAESERGGIGSGNSEYFNRVQEGLREVSHALQGQFGDFQNDNIKKLATAKKALQSLLEACISYTARKPKTEKGKVRKRIVEKLKEYAAQDVKGCSDALDALFQMPQKEMAAETWETVLRSARSEKINVEDFSRLEAPEKGKASDVVKLPMGTETKYFKREDSIDLDEFAGSDNMRRDIALKDTIAKYGEIPKKDKQYISELVEEEHNKDRQIEIFNDASEKGKPALKFFSRRYHQLGTIINTLFSDLELLDNGGRVNMTRRNVATSRMASLLGLKDLIAESQTVDILDEATGETIHGNLMNQAEGKEYDSVTASLKERKFKPSLLRDVTNLQVLDFLCGQVDRHVGNMMYKVDGDGNVTGIQGIDNDGSFGLQTETTGKGGIVFDTSGEEMIIPYMDAHLADRIMELDGDTLRYALMDLIREEEIDAAIKRLQIMQKGIENIRQKEAFRFLENEEAWTLNEDADEIRELSSMGGWGYATEKEKENKKWATENRGKGRSVEFSFHYYSQKFYNMEKNKDKLRKTAEEMYGISDPERLKLLLRYIEDKKKFRDEKGNEVADEMRMMYIVVEKAIRKKYDRSRNYVSKL